MKKVISAVLAGAMLATSVGVATPALAEETAAPAASVQKSSVNSVYNQYLDVLQRYKKAQDKNFSADAIRDYDVNGNLSLSSVDPSLSYALVDVAQDGVPELIIAKVGEQYNHKLNKGGYIIYDIFGESNGTVKRLFDTFTMGNKELYTLRESGMIARVIIAGGSYIYTQFHKLNANSTSPQLSHFVLQTGWVGEVPSYYRGTTDVNSYYPISEDEYNSLQNQYGYIQNIQWHPIDDYASLWSELNANTIPVFVDGIQISFDQQPIIQEDRTLVPLRGVFEALGATVYWNNDTRSVTAYKDGTTVELAIGSSTMYVNGQPRYLDVAGQIINDRTMVPLRAISEAFGAIVYWDNDTRTVRVYSEESTVPSDPDEPDVSDPDVDTPSNPDVSDPDVDTPSNPDVDYPVIEDPDNPEEEQPSVDDQTKNVAYNAALLQLQSGYSYDAYYGFKALGDYKDSAELMNQAYWLNQLSYNASRLQYQELYDIRTNFELLSEDDIKKLMPTTIWLQPGMQYAGGAYYTFNADGTGTKPSSLNDPNPNPIETVWFVENGGLFHYTKDFVEHYEITTDGYLKEFRKIVDGVVADIDIVGHGISGPMPMNGSEIFVDFNSNIGKGLEKYWKRLEQANYNISYQLDTNGIYYEVENQYN